MSLPAPFALLRDVRLARLVRRAQAGDRAAFRELYRALYPAVAGFIQRRVRQTAEAEELTAQVFLRLVESLDRVDARRPVFAYVLSMARNLILDGARRPVVVPEPPGGEPASDADPLRALVAAEERAAIREAVARLPEETQELLHLRFGEGLRYAEIAGVVGLTEQAVRQRVSRAVRELRSTGVAGAGEVAHEG